MKILSLIPIDRATESGQTYTGGEQSFIEICKRWIEAGEILHIVTSEYGQILFNHFGLKANVYTYHPFFASFDLNDSINIWRTLMKSRANEDYDFIYCPGEPFEFVVPAVIMKRKLKIPLVVSINSPITTNLLTTITHAFNISYPRSIPRRLRRTLVPSFEFYIRNLLLRKADLVFSVGSYIKNLLEKTDVDRERIYSIGSGIDYDHIRSVPSQKKIFDACFMGSLSPMKGIYDLIECWKMIVKEKADAKLLVMGSGSPFHTKRIQHLIEKSSLQQNITLKGFVFGDEKYELLKKSRIFIFPSYLESFGIAVCEAMACGLPVVAYDLPVYREWYGDNIIYVKKGDIYNFKDKTSLLLEDDALPKRMGMSGLEIVSKYSWNSLAQEMIDIITEKLQLNG